MPDFAEILTQDLRLVILRTLEQDQGYDLNESILHTFVSQLGHNPTRDALRTQLFWLREQGLVTLKEVVGVQVATLTERGADVATGRATVPGVKRPSPRS